MRPAFPSRPCDERRDRDDGSVEASFGALSFGAVAWVIAVPAGAQGVVKNTFGDWQMRCETPGGGAGGAMRHRAERRRRGPAERLPW